MSTKTEKKTTSTDEPKAGSNEFRDAIVRLQAELTALVDKAVKQRTPGTSFNPALIKEIRGIEARRNRMIVARFSTLLREGNPIAGELVSKLLQAEG